MNHIAACALAFNATIATMPAAAWPEGADATDAWIEAQTAPRRLYVAAQHPSARTWQPCQLAAARSINSFLPIKQKNRLNAPPKRESEHDPPKGGGWIWLTRELLESKAFRSLSKNAYRALFRIACEHMNHAGLENGRLRVTHRDFAAYGMHRNVVKLAIDELVASGLVAITRQGRMRYGADSGAATEFRLTWLPVGTEADFQTATNQWKNFSPAPQNCTIPTRISWGGERDAPRQIAKLKSQSPAPQNCTTYNIFPGDMQRATRKP